MYLNPTKEVLGYTNIHFWTGGMSSLLQAIKKENLQTLIFLSIRTSDVTPIFKAKYPHFKEQALTFLSKITSCSINQLTTQICIASA